VRGGYIFGPASLDAPDELELPPELEPASGCVPDPDPAPLLLLELLLLPLPELLLLDPVIRTPPLELAPELAPLELPLGLALLELDIVPPDPLEFDEAIPLLLPLPKLPLFVG